MARDAANLQSGEQIGAYTIIERVGAGGMGTVYKAFESFTKQIVAIKVMNNDISADTEFISRFEREYQAIKSLQHPNILKVYNAGRTNDGLSFIALEFIDGETLDKKIGSLSVKRSLEITDYLANAIYFANSRGIIHRDIKPSNVLIERNTNRVVLADFGIVKSLDSNSAKLTQTGLPGVGTVAYMSTEQALNVKLDGRSDEYSLAVMLFEMLTGRLPFLGPSETAMIIQHAKEFPPSLQTLNNRIPSSLERVILKALSKQPDERYNSVKSFNEALRRNSAETAFRISSNPNIGNASTNNFVPSVNQLRVNSRITFSDSNIVIRDSFVFTNNGFYDIEDIWAISVKENVGDSVWLERIMTSIGVILLSLTIFVGIQASLILLAGLALSVSLSVKITENKNKYELIINITGKSFIIEQSKNKKALLKIAKAINEAKNKPRQTRISTYG